MSSLFRRQALDTQRQKFHGAIVLVRSPWRTAVAAGFVLLVLALLAFAATHGFARKETVPGALQPSTGVIRVVAPQAGVLLPGGPALGQAVRAGDPVATLSTDLSSAAGPTQALVARTLEARQDRLQDELQRQSQQARQQQGLLDARVASLEASLAEQDRQLALQRERVKVARDVADRYPDLVKSGAVSPVEAAQRRDDLLDQQARLVTLEQAQLVSRRELDAARADRAALPLQAGREGSQLQREMQALAQARAETESRREAVLAAPGAGRIAARLVSPGQPVAAGQAVATLLPEGATLEAELEVPSRAAGFVRPGTPVWLRVDAFPYERFGMLAGHVREVSQNALSAADLDAAGLATGRAALAGAAGGTPGAYRVRVTLDVPAGGHAPAWVADLKPGMRVQASLVGETRSLLAWAFEPLAALRAAAVGRPDASQEETVR